MELQVEEEEVMDGYKNNYKVGWEWGVWVGWRVDW